MSRFLAGALRVFFYLLYHPFAWAYDFVADIVSMGRWKRWVYAVIPLLTGPQILELGFGPGHLQVNLSRSSQKIYGLDESRQMLSQARHRLEAHKFSPRLARGQAQNLPYASGLFQTVVATFPTQYIAHPDTLAEVMRVLAPGGRIVVLLAAWLTGTSIFERALQKLFRVTAQVPAEDQDLGEFLDPYRSAGFTASLRFVEMSGSRLMIIIGSKPR